MNDSSASAHSYSTAVRIWNPLPANPLNFNELGRIKSVHQVFIFKNIPHLIADHSCIVSSSYCPPFFDCSICFSIIAFTCAVNNFTILPVDGIDGEYSIGLSSPTGT